MALTSPTLRPASTAHFLAPSLMASSALLCMACGGTPSGDGTGGTGSATGGSGSASGGATSGGGGDASASGGAATGGSSAATGGSNGEAASVGRIQVHRTLALGESPGQVTAQFDYVEQDAWDAQGDGTACTSEQFGACSVATCQPGPEPNPDELPSPVRLHAGTIMLVPDRDDFTASGMPNGDDNEYAFTSTGTLLGEEIMTVTSSGGTIGPFQGMVQVPLAPFLTSHDASAAVQGVVVPISTPRTADLALSWDARGTAEEIQTVVTYPNDESPRIVCVFDAALGAGSITAPALALLPSGTEIHLFAVNKETVTTPEGTIELIGALEMFSPDRTGYPMFVLE